MSGLQPLWPGCGDQPFHPLRTWPAWVGPGALRPFLALSPGDSVTCPSVTVPRADLASPSILLGLQPPWCSPVSSTTCPERERPRPESAGPLDLLKHLSNLPERGGKTRSGRAGVGRGFCRAGVSAEHGLGRPSKCQAGLETQHSSWPRGQKVGSGPPTAWWASRASQAVAGGAARRPTHRERRQRAARRAGLHLRDGESRVSCSPAGRGGPGERVPWDLGHGGPAGELWTSATPRSPPTAPFLRHIITLNDHFLWEIYCSLLIFYHQCLQFSLVALLGALTLKCSPSGEAGFGGHCHFYAWPSQSL